MADDLTGACATGALIRRRGGKAPVWTAQVPQSHLRLLDGTVGIVDLAVRFAPPGEAEQLVRSWWQLLRLTWHGPIGLRIDSTLRGPIGAAIRAVLTEDAGCGIILAPAFPESGRTTRDSQHFVHGRPVSQTDAARDPWTPVHTDNVCDLIQYQLGEPVARLPLAVVHEGPEAIIAALDVLSERVVVADAETNTDIEAIAMAMAERWAAVGGPYREAGQAGARTSKTGSVWKYWLPADPGPLSAAYAARIYSFAETRSAGAPPILAAYDQGTGHLTEHYDFRQGPPVLAICGSLMETARWQLDMLARQPGVQLVIVSTAELRGDARALGNRLLGQWLREMPVFAVATSPILDADPEAIAPALATLTQVLWSQYPFAGCYLSGGDIAAHTLKALAVTRLDIEAEVLPLAALSYLADGPFAGQPIVTKGGAVGDQDAMVRCLAALQQAWHSRSRG